MQQSSRIATLTDGRLATSNSNLENFAKRSRSPKAKVEDAPFISNATVNRTTTEVLKKLFTRAKKWNVTFRHEPDWNAYMLDEPDERPRELHADEADRLNDAMRADYAPLFTFVQMTGLR